MSTPQPFWVSAVKVAVTVLVPVALILTSVRFLLTNAFIRLEYNMPGFPPDPYGLTKGERINGARTALAYLLNDSGIEFLGDLNFEDGTAVYNSRELGHMEDVKRVTRAALAVWIISLLSLVGLSLFLWRVDSSQAALQSLMDGSRWTLILMVLLGVGLVAAFSVVFVGFHRVFFEGDSWIFSYRDTLIRLFPERFWRDAFGVVAIVTLIEAGAVYLIARFLQTRPPGS